MAHHLWPPDDTSRQVHGMVKGLFSRLDPKTPDPPLGHRRGLDGRVGMTRGGSGSGSAAIGGVWHAGHECVRAHRGVWRACKTHYKNPKLRSFPSSIVNAQAQRLPDVVSQVLHSREPSPSPRMFARLCAADFSGMSSLARRVRSKFCCGYRRWIADLAWG